MSGFSFRRNASNRPWQGQQDDSERTDLPPHDPDCYLCPGNSRVNGDVNPDYAGPFVFANDFPALSPGSSNTERGGIFETRPEPGECRVICYTEKHDQRLSTMSGDEASAAVHALINEFADLDKRPDINYVQAFENRGEMMGCSNPHPHAQVWATSQIPTEIDKELREQQRWFGERGTRLLLDYCNAELEAGDRVVTTNDHFVAMVPYWATWPFETLIVPRRAVAAPTDFDAEEIESFAQVLVSVLSATDSLFDTSAPYSMGLHPRPSDGAEHPEWQFHVHICPPLLRSATVRKHMVGFEMFGMPQRDITPEAGGGALAEDDGLDWRRPSCASSPKAQCLEFTSWTPGN